MTFSPLFMLLLPQIPPNKHPHTNILQMNWTSNPELGWESIKINKNRNKNHNKNHPEQLWVALPQEQLLGTITRSHHLQKDGRAKIQSCGSLLCSSFSSVIHHFLPGSSVQLASGANGGNWAKIDIYISKSRRQMDLLSSKLSIQPWEARKKMYKRPIDRI